MSDNADNNRLSPRARSITALVEAAADRLRALDRAPHGDDCAGSNEERGALLYFGNWHDPIPRLLILDQTLDAGDVRLWAYLRTLFTQPGMPTVFPSYRQILHDLPMARATLAGCISTLRATRWITRCLTVRDARGRYKGSIYALHEEPLNLADTLHLDAEYMAFLAEATQHCYKRVRTIASAVLDTIRDRIGEDADITRSPTVLEQAERRFLQLQSLDQTGLGTENGYPDGAWSSIGQSQIESLTAPATEVIHSIGPSSDSELGKLGGDPPSSDSELGENGEKPPSSDSELGEIRENPPSSDSELGEIGEKSPSSDSELGKNRKNSPSSESEPGEKTNLRTSNSSCCSCSSSFFNKKTTTTTQCTSIPRTREASKTAAAELIFPPTLKPNEKPLVAMQIERIPQAMRQDVLDQLAGVLNNKNRKEPIRDPVAYLRTLCRRVLSGEFEMSSQGLAVKERRVREAARQRREKEATEAHDKKVREHLESIRKRSGNQES